ncbi:glycosyltransferase family protein [Xylanimonas ulmi]|uniref:Glycosyltransferase involved in cell wall biosynthesis n=1 Tax=Xylanimonas ulmi TaxID=228973 RepID=A0A4Q7LZ14_9MICO|nr:glycosyltransferase [Xylanibacterium ulmi]RZS59981.1 glycosyltransferase involved in cell wall biosynthesis [Xylanibacterium ulmi]
MIVVFGTYDAARHPRVAILAAGLRAHGRDVVELNHPLGLSTAERVRMLREPWRLPLLALRLLACWARLTAGAVALRVRRGAPEAVVVGYLGHFDVLLARALYPRTTLVLDHLVFAADTALDRGARGLRVRLLGLLDRAATGAADVVLTDTAEHLAMLRDPAKGVVVPVGAPDAWFAAGESDDAAPTPRDGEPLRVVFFGLYTPLQGAPVIGEALTLAAAAGTRLEVTMAGAGQDLAATRVAAAPVDPAPPVDPNPLVEPVETTGDVGVVSTGSTTGGVSVTWRDWVDPAALPALVAAHHVCLGIFSATPKGLRVVPNKVYQGLAAGRVVVTSDSAPQRRALGEHLELVPPADAAALAARLAALADPARYAAAAERARAGRDAARPTAVVLPLLERLERLDGARPGRAA